jgi:ABC-type multidrug transport system ATPase subunit
MTPEEGFARWNEIPLTRGNWRVRETVGYVPEHHRLYDRLTVSQTLLLCSRIYRNWDGPFITEWQRRFQLEGGKQVGKLSKGMRAKLQILIGLGHGSELLLLDEPTAGLDPDARSDLQRHIRALIEERQTCAIVSSHLFEDVETMTSRVKILRRGKVVLDAPLDRLDGLRLYRIGSPAGSEGWIQEMAVLKPRQEDGHLLVLAPAAIEEALRQRLPRSDLSAETVNLKQVYFLTQDED